MKHIFQFSIVLLIIFLLYSGCGKEDPVATNQAQTQNQDDSIVVNSIMETFNDVFAQIQWTPNRENIDQTFYSPYGGNVRVTGTITFNEELNTVNWWLNFFWWFYKIENNVYELTYNGPISFTGNTNLNHNISRNYIFSNGGISIDGTINGRSVYYKCPMSITIIINSLPGTSSISGSICGRSIDQTW